MKNTVVKRVKLVFATNVDVTFQLRETLHESRQQMIN